MPNNGPVGTVNISGTATEDQVLTVSHTLADADGLGTISYQWKRNGSPIDGATGSSYTLGDADVGKSITVVASYVDGNGKLERMTSTATAPVVNVNDSPTGTVSIRGTATENQVLRASNTLADADGLGTVSYQWQRDGADIVGATGSKYTLGDADVGKSITVVASYSDGHGTAESVTSAAVGPVVNVNDSPTGSVTIGGTATEDQVLTVSHTLADADGLGTISYQWKRNGSTIDGATGSNYTLDDADVGKSITVVASYVDGNGKLERMTSTATAPVVNVNDSPTGTVSIRGTATENQVLRASNTLADADGLGSVSYQWQRDGADIAGATGSKYTLGDADVGKSITVVASYSDGHGTAESVTSAAVGPVVNVNDSPTGSVAISGTATEDEVLTVSNTLADADGLGTISYRWKRDGSAIEGATGSSYTLGDADVGKSITVVASYSDGHGKLERVVSAASGPVANVNDSPTGSVAISGTATEDEVLTASHTLADDDGLGAVSYQWQRDGADIAGATGLTYTLGDADVGASITVVASYTDGHGTPESVTSAASGPVVNVNDAPTGTVSISGTATEDEVLTASHTLADADGLGTVSYQWQRDGADIAGATGSTYTLGDADVGASITVVASYSDGHGTAESVTSTATGPVANVNDAPTGTVSISGTATEDEVLTASHTLADADGLGTIGYQWQRDGADIIGATGLTYTLGDADVGASITVVASYTDGHGTPESVTSAASGPVVNVNDAPTGTVTISGTATEDEVLTASHTLADADGLGTIGYQWQRDGADIIGATGLTYTLGDADVGASITVVASYTDGHGTAESVTSAASGPVVNVNDAPTGTVSISGTATEDEVLTASHTLADADGLGTVSYQWQRDGADIAGATGSTYTLGDADVGASITVVASYSDGHGTAESVTSTATGPVANVNDAPTGAVSISGTATEDQVLTASHTLADADGLGTVSYQWQRDGADIAGATGSTYTLGDADVGKSITVVANYSDGHGKPESVTSAASGPVANVNDTPTGTVSISGTATEDQVLTASNTLADADGLGMVSYQWQRDGADIAGATGSTYTLGDADVGASITVVASYSDGHGTAESATSAATDPVVNVNDSPTGSVTISGTATEDQVLTASNTLADADGLGTISYQWQRDGSNIAGATGSTYALGDADVGKSITVVAGYIDGHGTSESVSSAPTSPVANVNDAPVNAVPGAQSVAEDIDLVFSGGRRITVSDVDLGDGNATVTLSVAHGTLTLASVAGLDFSAGDGTADGSMSFVGTVAAISAALDGAIYRGLQDYNGPDTLTIVSGDGELTDSDSVAITVNGVNDPPADLSLSASEVVENIAGALIGSLSVSDVDLGDTVTYSIRPGLDGGLFSIDGNRLQVGSVGLDYEASTTRSVIVRATDASGAFIDRTFIISVIDRAEVNLTSGTDVVPASAANTQIIGTSLTLNAADSLDGGEGTDSLVLYGGGTFNLNALAGYVGIEEVQLVNSGSYSELYLRSGTTTAVTTTGTAAKYIYLSGSAAASTVTTGADGSTYVNLSGSSSIGSFQGGGGYDEINFQGTGSATSVDLGGGGDFISFTAGNWSSGISIDGGSGYDNLQLYGSATIDLRPSVLASFELLYIASNTVQIDADTLDDFTYIYGNSTGKLVTDAAALDLTGKTVASISVQSTNAGGTVFSVSDIGTAFQVFGGSGSDTLQTSSFAFSAADRQTIFAATSIETIIDTNGSYAAPAADPSVIKLTTGSDTVVPTSADVTINGTSLTLNAADSLDGGEGTDSLVLYGGGTFNLNALAGYAGIEEVQLVNSGSSYSELYLRSGTTTAVTTTGTAAKYIYLSGSAAASTVTTGADGSTYVNLSGSSSIGSFQGGGGYDEINFQGTGSATSVDLGGGGDFISFTAGNWSSGISIDGGSGYDNLQLYGSATIDLRPSVLASFELLYIASNTVQIDADTLDDFTYIYGNSTGKLVTDAAALDLTGKTVASISVQSTNAGGTVFSVSDIGTAFQVFGGSGSDTLQTSSFAFSAADRQTIFAATSIETIIDTNGSYAAPAADPSVIKLTTGSDTVVPTSADVTINGTSLTLNAADSLDGGEGTDSLVLYGGGTFNLNALAGYAGIEEVQLVNSGSSYSELYLRSGTTTAVTTTGTAAKYIYLSGSAAASTVTTGADGSTYVNLSGSSSIGSFHGGGGYDEINFQGTGSATSVDLGGGGDFISFTAGNWSSGISIDGGSGYDNLQLYGSATIDLRPSVLASFELLYIASNTVQIDADTLDDFTYIYGNSTGKLVTDAAALDLTGKTVASISVQSTNAGGTVFSVSDIGTAFQVFGGSGSDTLQTSSFAFSAADRQTIFAATSIELIQDTSGFYGGETSNTIAGSAAGEIIEGGGGADRIVGAGGADALAGGSGADTFVFNAASDSMDTISDFLSGTDILEFSAAGFGGGLVAGMNAATVFGSSADASFASAVERFHFDTATSILYFDSDGNGVQSAHAIVQLQPGSTLTASDLTIA